MIKDDIINIATKADTLSLTVNQRLSVEMKRWHQLQQKKQHHRAWHPLSVHPLNSWIKILWEQLAEDKTLLSPWQSHNLWLQIISKDSSRTILNPNKTAQLASQAWQLLHHWSLPIKTFKHELNEDITAFLDWMHQFQFKLNQLNAITEAQLLGGLPPLLANANMQLPHQILLFGFDQVPPALETLLNALSKRCEINWVDPVKQDNYPQLIAFDTPEEELIHIAHWAIKQVNTGAKRVGIIFPDLNRVASQLKSQFRLLTDDAPALFNFSAGQSLYQQPIVQAALNCLQLCFGKIDVENLHHYLISPYLNQSEQEIQSAALIDRKIREQYAQTIDIAFLFQTLAKIKLAYPTTLNQRLHEFYKLFKKSPKQQPPSQWAETALSLLRIMGWPGGKTISSLEYQAMQRFIGALEEYCQLDMIYKKQSFQQALSLLKQLTQSIVFQAEGSDTPIQVLGTLESSGLTFDAVWFAGVDTQAWPSNANPNPFIPLSIQRQLELPHSSTEKELQYCELITDRILSSAAVSFCSYSKTNAEKRLDCSALLYKIQPKKIEPKDLNLIIESHNPSAISQPQLELINDHLGPAIASDELIKGGSAILKSQSNCAFQSFAMFRLGAQPLANPIYGINPMQRGNLTHQCLESIWNHIDNHHSLCQLSEKQINQLIHKTVEENLSAFSHHTQYFDNHYFTDVEQIRLTNILNRWLNLEKQRPPFKVIANEFNQTIKVGGLKMKLKIDRIDQLHNGEQIIIDYKTGNSQVSSWFGDRLLDPQLPLYCAFSTTDKPFKGISFAEIRSQKMQFKGVACESLDTLPTGIKPINQSRYHTQPNWDLTLQHWQQQIIALSEKFSLGDATVDPHSSLSCRYCDFQSFCRKQPC